METCVRPVFGLAIALLALAACAGGPAARREASQLANGSYFAEINGFRIHYEVHGRGPVLMTVPNSWGLSLAGLRALYRPLEERLTLVYFDPRGMGQSAPVREDADMGMAAVRADFEALRVHLGVDRVNAIGWSNGAMNLILLAAENPASLSAAIFLHGFASLTGDDENRIQEEHPQFVRDYTDFQKLMTGPRAPQTIEEQNALVKRYYTTISFPYLFADRENGQRVLPQLYSNAEFSWRHSQYSQQESPTFDARDQLPLITARSLVVAGAKDLLPPARAKELHDGVRGSQFVVFENSGHFSPVEEPEAFNKTIFEFLGVGRP